MIFLLTFVLTLILVLLAMWFFICVAPPVYRLNQDNIIALLELVISGQAKESDWHVFIGIPLRHNAFLADIQQRCSDLSETEYVGSAKATLFTEKGTNLLKMLLEELKQGKQEEKNQ